MKFFCIADEDTVRGFRLAGIDGIPATHAQEFRQALAIATADPETGVVLIGRRLAETHRESLDSFRLAASHPLWVEIPSPFDSIPAPSASVPLIQSALGIGKGIGIGLESPENL